MKTKWKTILFIALLSVGFIVLCIFSYYYGFMKGLRACGLASHMAEVMVSEQHYTAQMSNANCEGVKQAIKDHLQRIEKYKNVEGSLVSDTIYYGDKMLAHIRLARIEKHMGKDEEAKKHMTIAKEACAYRKWEDCSEEKLVWFAKRLEEKNPIACLVSEK